jgi:hypothetical protein
MAVPEFILLYNVGYENYMDLLQAVGLGND